MISQQTINKVFEATRVEEVVAEFVQLKKAGVNLKALSPFTDEKTPSFVVSPVKQIWKDFSTGKGGNSISFLMEHEHYTFPEAVRWLAKKYNIEVEEVEQSEKEKQQINERENLFLVSKFAKDYFSEILLQTQIGRAVGLSYFKERGFDETVIEKFELGYCKDKWNDFTEAALTKGYELKHLKATGLTIVKEEGDKSKKFDRFKGRVMFPIHSMSGRVLGFGGRTLTKDKKVAKYVNSPESEIYNKSKVLYGLYHAKKEIAKSDRCYLVEGYTDVISFHQSGIENVVASSGTALTPEQVYLLKRLTKNITVLFDSDPAGIRASIRGIDLILEQGLNVQVVLFAEGDDPDSFAKSHSSEELKNYLEHNTQDFIEFKVSLFIEEAQNNPAQKASLIRDIVSSIAKIPKAIEREIYIQQCAKLMSISEQVLFSELAQLLQKKSTEAQRSTLAKAKATTKTTQAIKIVKDKESSESFQQIDQLAVLEKEIIRILLLYGNQTVCFVNWIVAFDKNNKRILEKQQYQNTVFNELYLNLQEDEIEFSNKLFRLAYKELINQLNQSKKIDIDQLVRHSNTELSSMIVNLIMDDQKYVLSNWEKKEITIPKPVDVLPKLVNDAILNLRRVLIDIKIKEILKKIEAKQAPPNVEEIKNYIKLKMLLYEKLNRVV
ncbi:MAG: DNA primase [Tenacibaculum sp.]